MITKDLEDKLSQNFIDYSYETNSNRAFPDARDGLKPSQRCCLWEMYTKGYSSNKPHVKSAKISGGVIANFSPHSDTSAYETFGRMSQPWVNNLPEVDFHGANGSIVMGSRLASSRYTEARLSKAAEDGLLQNIKKNTKMILNFSEDLEMPEVLPALFPRLLVNGSQGIGVSIANTWAPMNLVEVGNVILTYIKEKKFVYDYLFDFPSGGIIINKDELIDIHKTGKGKIILRGKATIEDNKILITELPYQVYVEPFITSVVDLITKDKIDGIEDIINKTDKKNMLIEVICDKSPKYVLQKLYKLTDLETVINPNQYALISKTPTLLTLQQYVDTYISHNVECIKRECEFDLSEANKRLEIVEGLIKAIDNIDKVIEIIKGASDNHAAQVKLVSTFALSDRQAKAIIDMRLGRLAKLETKEFEVEKDALNNTIMKNTKILSSEDEQLNILYERLSAFINQYGTPRKTELVQLRKEDEEALEVAPEEMVVVVTENNNIKRIPSSTFKPQLRGGKGSKVQPTKTKWVLNTNTTDTLLIFTSKGYAHKLKVSAVPLGDNVSKGNAIDMFITLDVDEEIMAITCLSKTSTAQYCMFLTKKGLIKKLKIEEVGASARKSKVINFYEDDELADICFVEKEEVIIISKNSMSVRLKSEDIAPTGKSAKGIKGINLAEGDEALTLITITPSVNYIVLISNCNTGKRLPISEYPVYKRGAKGVKTLKKGTLIGAVAVSGEENLLIHGNSKNICISCSDLPSQKRASVGVKVMDTTEIVAVSKV